MAPVASPRARHSGRIAIGIAAVMLGYLVATAAASVLRNPSRPAILAPGPLLWTVVAGAVGGVTFGSLGRRLRLSTARRAGVLLVVIYSLTTLSNGVEAVLFVRGVSPLILLAGLVQAAGLAVPAAIWWPPETGGTLRPALLSTLAGRPWWSWTWRVVLVAMLWVPVYFAFAAADAPFMHSYYSGSTTFTIPDGRLIALAEVLRGLLHAIVLGGLAALLGGGRRYAWRWLAAVFAVGNGWLPLLQRVDWPYFLRFANGLEISGDAVVFAALVVWLLTPARGGRTHRRRMREHKADVRADRRATTPPHHA